MKDLNGKIPTAAPNFTGNGIGRTVITNSYALGIENYMNYAKQIAVCIYSRSNLSWHSLHRVPSQIYLCGPTNIHC